MKLLYHLKQLILASGDLVCFSIGFWLSLIVRNFELPSLEKIATHITIFFFLFIVWIIINYIDGLYDLKVSKDKAGYRKIIESAIISLCVGIVFFYILPQKNITPKTILVLNIIFGYGLVAVWRLIYNGIIGDKKLHTNILFLGYNKEIQELITIMSKQPRIGYKCIALFDPESKVKTHDFSGISVYSNLTALRPAVTTHHINVIVTAQEIGEREEVIRELYELLFWPVHIIDLPSFYETVTGRIPPTTFSESWFLKNLCNTERPLYNKTRRLIDIIAAFVLGIILIAMIPFVALATKINSRGPIFFKQKRIGQGEKIFWIYKFRTMYAMAKDGSAEMQGAEFAKKNDERITSVGNFLRKTRLDELPQVINLLKGDLTLVGPRPERPEIVEQLVTKMSYYPLRHTVKPGITGWAAIHQHYTDTLETSLQKLQYDLYYIKNRSILLDLSILLRTINVVMRGMGQ